MFLYIQEYKKERDLTMSIAFEKSGMARAIPFGNGPSSQNIKNKAAQNLSSGRPNTFSFRDTGRGWVRGQNTIKGRYNYDYTAARERFYTPPQVDQSKLEDIRTVAQNIQVNNDTSFVKGQIVAGLGVGLFQLLNSVRTEPLRTASPQGASARLDASLGNLSTGTASTVTSSAAQSAIANMNSATSSATLRQAINGAQSQLAQLSYANTPETQNEYNTAKADYESAKGEVETNKKAVTDAKQEVSTAKDSVKTLTETRDAKKGALTNAMTKKNQCDSKYASAHADAIAAQTAFNNTPDTITDVNGNTIKNPAKETARQNLEKAKTAENEAKQALDQAKQNEIAADKDVKKAEQDLEAEQKKLTERENILSNKETALKKAEDNLKASEKKRDDAKAKMDQIDSDKKDYATLQNEITKQNERLAKLEQDEQNQFNDLSGKIDKKAGEVADRATRIDTSNGMNISERIRQNKNEKANERIKEMSAKKDALSDNVAITNLLRDSNYTQGKGGEELRTTTLPSGRTVYFVNSKEVSQADFEAAMA